MSLRNYDTKKKRLETQFFTRMAFFYLTACHEIKFDELYSTTILVSNPAHYSQTTCALFLYRIFLFNLFIYLVQLAI